ncbi:hypothetical protein K435DRAFT_401427 [Dendrothele bispora CBS 962.96]|uniref:F-box domain-containing protein n=1 Tax=Dendrothele bispora (strain CBS 962.96) TaxID=1314807 RepID=A0A4S8MFZ6_DENBC|nr:hypothetical protein K435DRAFT_401427 [Dendrothele bispora CBS 962.96]
MVCRDCSQDDAGTTAHFIPDLDERLRSPNAFSTSDNAQITELIDRAGTELTACQTEIASLRSRIALLTRKHDMMKLHIEKARSLLAPVRKLPNEILVEIFMLLADARLSFDPPEFVKVCKRWYSLALSTPRLWSDSPIYIIRRDDQTLIQVKQWLRLSRMIPLHITLCGDIVSQMPSTNDHEQILQEVLAHSARWKSLRITQIGSLVSYLGANQLNALEHVQFSNADTSPALFSSFWSSCPNVHDLIVVAISSEVVNTFPWNQIKRLAVNQHSLRILSQIQTLDGLECLRFFYSKALPSCQQTWETGMCKSALQPCVAPALQLRPTLTSGYPKGARCCKSSVI